jgi:Tfp pilus assembly protein PilV
MKPNNSGFSMIEVLVAATILIMIVMMLGMIFQQTSQAWRTGRHRAGTYQQVRALFGAIQRDANMAVDEKSLPESYILKTGKGQNFSGTLQFFTLTGSSEKNKPLRSITHVTYTGGSRSVSRFDWAWNQQDQGGQICDDAVTFTPVFDDTKANTDGPNPFPDYVKVTMSIKKGSKEQNYDVGAASSGPDLMLGKGAADNKRGKPGYDDIKTWVD